MGDHDDGLGKFLAGDFQQAQHVLTGSGIQIARRLIRQNDGGRGGKGAGDGHPLLLTAGQLAGKAPQLLFQTQGVHDFVEEVLVHLPPVQLDGQDDVFPRVQHRHQIVALEDKADLPPAENGQRLIFQRKDVLPVHDHAAGGGPVKAAQHVQKGGFPGAGGAHNGDKFAAVHTQVHAVQRPNLRVPGAVDFAQVSGFQNTHNNLQNRKVCIVFTLQTLLQDSFYILSGI